MVDKIVEESIETTIEMTFLIEAGTGLEKGHFPEAIITIKIEVQAIVGPGQDREQVLIETGFDVISVGNMITSQRTVPLLGTKRYRTAPTNAQFGRWANLINILSIKHTG